MRYQIDNVKNYSKTKGWLCGQFFPNNSLQKNNQLEIKYEQLKPGDTHLPHYHPHGTEVCIIIKGKLKWQLDGKEYILQKGDFIFMENNVTESILKVYKPTTIITARTPSVKDNKVEVKKTNNR